MQRKIQSKSKVIKNFVFTQEHAPSVYNKNDLERNVYFK